MSVFYKFKAWREPATIPVDSTGISVWDLKKEIILANNLAPQSKDFDLNLYNSQSNEEFMSDHVIIPRSTTIIAQRLPAKRPHRGTAQNYVVEQAVPSSSTAQTAPQRADYRGRVMSMRFDNQNEQSEVPGLSPAAADHASTDVNQDEAARIEAMFEQTGQQWEQTQSEMAMRKRMPYSKPGGPGAAKSFGGGPQQQQPAFTKPPPTGYVCYRCGKPGHWIQECPTNDDPNFENRPRAKRTTGIPKSFLQTVDTPAEGQSGLMIGADGGFVIARPDAASWAQHRSTVPKNLSADDVQALQPEDPDLQCSIDSRLLREAVKVPCCSTSFCQECITKYLQAHSFVCPECESKVKSVAQLKPDEDRRQRVSEYIEEMLQASRENKAKEEEDGEKASSETKEEGKDKENGPSKPESPSTKQEDGSKSPSSTPAPTDSAALSEIGPVTQGDGGVNTPSGPPAMNAMMLQMQMQQMMMMMSNPMLPPPLRMQYTMQLQQLQMMMMMSQQQQQPQYDQHQTSNAQSRPGVGQGARDASGNRISPFYPGQSPAPAQSTKRRADSELAPEEAKRSRDSQEQV